MTANGPRLRFFRDVTSVALDVNAVERVTYAAQGSADTISFADPSETGVRQIAVNLASITNSSAADQRPDRRSHRDLHSDPKH